MPILEPQLFYLPFAGEARSSGRGNRLIRRASAASRAVTVTIPAGKEIIQNPSRGSDAGRLRWRTAPARARLRRAEECNSNVDPPTIAAAVHSVSSRKPNWNIVRGELFRLARRGQARINCRAAAFLDRLRSCRISATMIHRRFFHGWRRLQQGVAVLAEVWSLSPDVQLGGCSPNSVLGRGTPETTRISKTMSSSPTFYTVTGRNSRLACQARLMIRLRHHVPAPARIGFRKSNLARRSQQPLNLVTEFNVPRALTSSRLSPPSSSVHDCRPLPRPPDRVSVFNPIRSAARSDLRRQSERIDQVVVGRSPRDILRADRPVDDACSPRALLQQITLAHPH